MELAFDENNNVRVGMLDIGSVEKVEGYGTRGQVSSWRARRPDGEALTKHSVNKWGDDLGMMVVLFKTRNAAAQALAAEAM